MSYNVPIGNWTSYVQKEVNGKENSTFIVGQSGGGNIDPAYGCRKRFTATYQCGSGPTKTVNIDPEAWGQAATFDCTAENKVCAGFKLTLGDDGNIVITDNSNKQLWTSNTNKTGLALPQYSAKNGKYGRNYLLSGETLSIGEFIGSPSGNCYLIMASDQDTSKGAGLQLKYNISSCTMSDENTGFGTDDNSFATYSINKVNTNNLGKVGYISNNGKIHEYPSTMLGQGTDYSLLGNYNSKGNDIKNITNVNVDQCKKSCNEIDDCNGFVYSAGKKTSGIQFIKLHFGDNIAQCVQISQLAVYSNGVNVAQGKPVTSTPSFGKSKPAERAVDGTLSAQDYPDLYHSNCNSGDYWLLDLQQEFPIEKIVYYNRNNNTYSSRAKGMMVELMDSSKKILKTLTLTGDVVQTYDVNIGQPASPEQCWLKNSEMFPKGLRQEDNDLELYIRNKSVTNNNSCNKTVEASTITDWELFPIGEKMTMDTLCNLGAITEQERKELEQKHTKLSGIADIIKNKLQYLTKEKSKIDMSMDKNINKLKTDISSYHNIWEQADNHIANTDNINAILEDTDLNMVSQNYKYLLWTILAILLIIGGIRVTRST
jgi:hypothetical protein